MRRSIALLIALTLPFLAAPAPAQMQRAELNASFFRIDAEVAASPGSRSEGLMFRRKMGANQGMIFIFPNADRHCMWMRNTLIPLSVAFLDASGKIINIEDMQPQTEASHCAADSSHFALEMNIGWFTGKGITPGRTIGGIEFLPKPQ